MNSGIIGYVACGGDAVVLSISKYAHMYNELIVYKTCSIITHAWVVMFVEVGIRAMVIRGPLCSTSRLSIVMSLKKRMSLWKRSWGLPTPVTLMDHHLSSMELGTAL